MGQTIGTMIADIRTVNIAKGWRSAEGGPGQNTLGDYIALLETETGEATDAYRSWRLADATGTDPDRLNATGPAKPEGVGSELADVLIRLLDTSDVFGFVVAELDFEIGDIADLDPALSDPRLPELITFGDHMAWLNKRFGFIWEGQSNAGPHALRALVTVARKYGVDLDFEYERKLAYNRTRAFRHGGRALTDSNA